VESERATRHESLPCPARGLELVVYRREAVQSTSAEPNFELNLNTGRSMTFRLDLEPDPKRATLVCARPCGPGRSGHCIARPSGAFVELTLDQLDG
jgi:hypothetical protein